MSATVYPCNPVDFRYSVVSRNLWSLTDPSQAFRWSYYLQAADLFISLFHLGSELLLMPSADRQTYCKHLWTALLNNLNDQEIFLGLIKDWQSDTKMVKINLGNSPWKCWFPLLRVFPSRKYHHLLDLFYRPRINDGGASFSV